MLKKIGLFLLLVAMSISAYAGNTLEVTKNYNLPDGMKDCRVFQLTDGLFTPVLYITKCPLSKTSTSNMRHKSTDLTSTP